MLGSLFMYPNEHCCHAVEYNHQSFAKLKDRSCCFDWLCLPEGLHFQSGTALTKHNGADGCEQTHLQQVLCGLFLPFTSIGLAHNSSFKSPQTLRPSLQLCTSPLLTATDTL